MYMGYEADRVRARGQLTATNVLVAAASAVAYGAEVTTGDSSIGIDSPFPFRFQGAVTGIDLRRVPATVPVPRVESLLTFDYDVSGRFARSVHHRRRDVCAFVSSSARSIGDGTVGSIDTVAETDALTGDGDVEGIDLRRLRRRPRRRMAAGAALRRHGVRTFPRCKGPVPTARTLTLTGGGRLARAEIVQRHALRCGRVDRHRSTGRCARRSTAGSRRSIRRFPLRIRGCKSSLTGSGRVTRHGARSCSRERRPAGLRRPRERSRSGASRAPRRADRKRRVRGHARRLDAHGHSRGNSRRFAIRGAAPAPSFSVRRRRPISSMRSPASIWRRCARSPAPTPPASSRLRVGSADRPTRFTPSETQPQPARRLRRAGA